MASSATHLLRIFENVQDLKDIRNDYRRCCKLLIKVLDDCREATLVCTYQQEVDVFFELGCEALRVASDCIQRFYFIPPPLLSSLQWYPTIIRRFDLTTYGTLRRSLLEMVMDSLCAHPAITDLDDENERTTREHFLKLAKKAFSLCFGDLVTIHPGELKRVQDIEIDYQHSHVNFGIDLAKYHNPSSRTWQRRMFPMILRVLIALARSHSSWFHGRAVHIWGEEIIETASGLADISPATRFEERSVDVTLLTDFEKAFLQRQVMALKDIQATATTKREYISQIRTAINIIRISTGETQKSSNFSYEFFQFKSFDLARKALLKLTQTAQRFFQTDINPSRNEPFNPESQPRTFPLHIRTPRTRKRTKHLRLAQREHSILTNLDQLFRSKPSDSKRLIFAEIVLNLCCGIGLTIVPPTGSRTDIKLEETWSESPSWREQMLKYTELALVGLGQYLKECFPGRELCLWDGEGEFPKKQEVGVWIGCFGDGKGAVRRHPVTIGE